MSTLHGILKYYTDTDVAIVAAFRDSNTDSENDIQTNKLKSEIRSMGYGFSVLTGHFPDKVKRTVLLVNSGKLNQQKKNDFLQDMKKVASHYDQDSIIYSPHDSHDAFVVGLTNVDENGRRSWPGNGRMISIGPLSTKIRWKDDQ